MFNNVKFMKVFRTELVLPSYTIAVRVSSKFKISKYWAEMIGASHFCPVL